MPISKQLLDSIQRVEMRVTQELRDGLLTQSQFEDMYRKVSILRSDFCRIAERYDRATDIERRIDAYTNTRSR